MYVHELEVRVGCLSGPSPPQFSRQLESLKLEFTYLATVVGSGPGTH